MIGTADRVRRARRIGFCVVLTLLCPFIAASSLQSAIQEGRTEYSVNGKRILVERYEPADAGRHPAIILLHGSGGVLFPGLDLRRRARGLAERGYGIFLVHYLNQTGHIIVPYAQVHRNLDTWTNTVRAGVTFVSHLATVDPERMGIMGYSLGAYLALKTASEDARIKVVLDASGALDATDKVKRMPPALILHGAQDKTVPVTKAYRLEALLQKTKTPYQMHIYLEEAHIFSKLATVDALKRIEAFLIKYLPARRTRLHPTQT